MKMLWKELLVCALMGVLLPGTLMQAGKLFTSRDSTETTPPETMPVMEPFTGNPPIRVKLSDGSLKTMDLEEYLVGVVLAEMPADFELEALKAQAVAARTYAARAETTGGKHGDGSICTDSGCCQAYMTVKAYYDRDGSPLAVQKIRRAVEETRGKVLTYQGKPIDATYFSCSGGYTEDAAAVWGTEFPYLKSVESPGEEQSDFFSQQVIFSREEVERLLSVSLPENPAQWLGERTETPGRGVSTLTIGGRVLKGTELRSLLGLRSTAFTASADDRGLVLQVRGYGHRVGMSQYGADAMAATGKTCEDILSHYYPGTDLVTWTGEFTEDSQTEIAKQPK